MIRHVFDGSPRAWNSLFFRGGRAWSFLFCGLAFWSACAFSGCGEKPHPSSKALAEQYHTHRQELGQLVEMFLADDALGRVAPTFTRPDDPATIGVSPERIAEYRRLLKAAKIETGIEGYAPKEIVWFHVSSLGLSISGSGKGLAYRSKPPQAPDVLVEDLDTYVNQTLPTHPKSFTAFQLLEGNWYLYFDYED